MKVVKLSVSGCMVKLAILNLGLNSNCSPFIIGPLSANQRPLFENH